MTTTLLDLPRTHGSIAEIERAVRVKTSGQVRDLQIEIIGSDVVLCGRASTYYAKQLATQAVLELDGELSLTNHIEVC